MASKRNKHEEQAAKTRLQMFEAKQELEFVKQARRNRDNRLAVVASVSAVALTVALQFAYFSFGPGKTLGAQADVLALPDASIAESSTWLGNIFINKSRLAIQLDGRHAPQATANFLSLAQSGFFDKTKCHRLTTETVYVLQCGDPKANGTGGPGYSFGPIENDPEPITKTVGGQELKLGLYPAGTIAMARQGDNAGSQGSQFFIVYKDSYFPNDSVGGYTIFGKVMGGLDQIDPIIKAGTKDKSADGQPAITAAITGVTFDRWPAALKPTPTPSK